MVRRMLLFTVVLAAVSSNAWAQSNTRMQVSVLFGYTLSDGVTGGPYTINGKAYDRVDPKDGANVGFQFGFEVNPKSEVGFMYRFQQSKLVVSGPSVETEVGNNMGISSYHGYYAYYFGDPEGRVNPYVLFGLGATSFAAVNYTPPAGVEDPHNGSIPRNTEFSSVVSTGVRINAGKHFGVKAGVAWTPTYIKSDPDGWWCGWYGCYVVGNAQYANQFHFEGALTFRF